MIIYHNTEKNFLYFVSYRNGSSILQDISTVYDSLKVIEPKDAFRLLANQPDIAIHIPYRDPEVRFKSALAITLIRDQSKEYKNNSLTEVYKKGYHTLFKEKITYLDTICGNHVPFLAGVSGGFKRRPYHLFDSHLDHSLWLPMFLILYNFNVKLISLKDWSLHLKPLYPKAIKFIEDRERPESSSTNRPEVEPLWQTYKSVFIDRKLETFDLVNREYAVRTLRWKDWMAPEKQIYHTLNLYKDSQVLKMMTIKLFKNLFKEKVYFTDPFSPGFNTMTNLINQIHVGITPLPEIDIMMNNKHSISFCFNQLFGQ